MGLILLLHIIVLVQPRIKSNKRGIVAYLQGLGTGPEPLRLGLFWQPAAHCCHTLFGIEKQPKFTSWIWVLLVRGWRVKSTKTAACK